MAGNETVGLCQTAKLSIKKGGTKVTRFKRVLLKVSGEALQGEKPINEQGKIADLDPRMAAKMARKIKAVHDLGVQVAVVMGGGNLCRGKDWSKDGMDRVTADYVGMLGTIMNGLVLMDALERLQSPVRLMSALSMPVAAELYVRNKALRHLAHNRILILTAGTGVPYVTTDTGASLRALELRCEVLIKATKESGVYDRNPHEHSDARRFKTLNYRDAINMSGVEIIDTSALAMCQESNLPSMVFKMFDEQNLLAAIQGEDVGTYLDNRTETAYA
ncbi:MAG: UMP kinase [Clostridiales bacterium]|nr:UMP kinase [Clostridiales bacterium]